MRTLTADHGGISRKFSDAEGAIAPALRSSVSASLRVSGDQQRSVAVARAASTISTCSCLHLRDCRARLRAETNATRPEITRPKQKHMLHTEWRKTLISCANCHCPSRDILASHFERRLCSAPQPTFTHFAASVAMGSMQSLDRPQHVHLVDDTAPAGTALSCRSSVGPILHRGASKRSFAKAFRDVFRPRCSGLAKFPFSLSQSLGSLCVILEGGCSSGRRGTVGFRGTEHSVVLH